jgi:hypothetical protein
LLQYGARAQRCEAARRAARQVGGAARTPARLCDRRAAARRQRGAARAAEQARRAREARNAVARARPRLLPPARAGVCAQRACLGLLLVLLQDLAVDLLALVAQVLNACTSDSIGKKKPRRHNRTEGGGGDAGRARTMHISDCMAWLRSRALAHAGGARVRP